MILFGLIFTNTGGYEIMLDYAGADATQPFMYKPHSKGSIKMLEKYLIGELVQVIWSFSNYYKF